MVTCSKCSKSLSNPSYLVRQLGYLCGECAKKHGEQEIDQLQKDISKLNFQMMGIQKRIREAIYNDCDHEYVDTGYGFFSHADGKHYSDMRCKKCGKLDKREW